MSRIVQCVRQICHGCKHVLLPLFVAIDKVVKVQLACFMTVAVIVLYRTGLLSISNVSHSLSREQQRFGEECFDWYFGT